MECLKPTAHTLEDENLAKRRLVTLVKEGAVMFDSWSRIGTSLSFLIAATDGKGGLQSFLNVSDLHQAFQKAKGFPRPIDTTEKTFTNHVKIWAIANATVPWCDESGRLKQIQGLQYREQPLNAHELSLFCSALRLGNCEL